MNKTTATQLIEALAGCDIQELIQRRGGKGFRNGRLGKHAGSHLTHRQRVLKARSQRLDKNPQDAKSRVFRRVNWRDEEKATGLRLL